MTDSSGSRDHSSSSIAPMTLWEDSEDASWMDAFPFAKQLRSITKGMSQLLGLEYGGEFFAALEESQKLPKKCRLVYGDRDHRETTAKLNSNLREMFGSFGAWKPSASKTGDPRSKDVTLAAHDGSQSEQNLLDLWSSLKDKPMQEWLESMSEKTQSKREEMERNRERTAKLTEGISLWEWLSDPNKYIEAMKDRDKIREKNETLRKTNPKFVKELIDERDVIMVNNLKKCDGKIIVAIVGIGHMDGMEQLFADSTDG